jgi:hypothetical protein
MEKLQVSPGDAVTWKSQSSGFETVKYGTVIMTRKIGSLTFQLQTMKLGEKYRLRFRPEETCRRDGPIALVRVEQGPGRKPWLYAPRVSYLKKLED